jgi:hypothetical protein
MGTQIVVLNKPKLKMSSSIKELDIFQHIIKKCNVKCGVCNEKISLYLRYDGDPLLITGD